MPIAPPSPSRSAQAAQERVCSGRRRALTDLARRATGLGEADPRWAGIAARAWLACAAVDDRASKAIVGLAERFPSAELRKLAAHGLAITAGRAPKPFLSAREAYAAVCEQSPDDASAWLMLLRTSRLTRHRTRPALLADALERLPALDALPPPQRALLSAERALARFELRQVHAGALLDAWRELDAGNPRRVELARAYALGAVTSSVPEHDTIAALLWAHPEIADEVAELALVRQRWELLYEAFAELPLRGVAGGAVAEAYLALRQEQDLVERTAGATEDAGAAVLYARARALVALAALRGVDEPETLRRSACRALEQATAAAPDHVLSQILWAATLLCLGEVDEAVTRAEEWLGSTSRRHPSMLRVLAEARRARGEHEAARHLLREVVEGGGPWARAASADLRAWYGLS